MTQRSKFLDQKCELSNKFIEKFANSGILDKVELYVKKNKDLKK